MNPSKRLLPFHSSDAVLALFVVTITAMLLVSLPTALIDFLLACNLGFSLLLLLVALYVPNSLALLAFPSLLLLSTLFRLGLNVASTRLILLQGDAGDVIQAFGDFLIQGEIVVGILIFIIITVVNYVVVARGSSRVAEVAARFTLDALPGKQMAIDAELRSGLISADQAQNKRDKLRQESQLYGAMDGAMKFVQGDVVAGFFIIVVNMLGGLYLGVSRGLSLPDAISTYTTLTVGDGLVSQIPALLISICAGIVVTRVVSSEGTTLGVDLGRQLFGTTETVFIAGLLLIGVGMLPGLPPLPFFVVGGVTLLVGIYLVRSNEREVGDLAHSDLVGPSSDALRTAKLVVSLDDQMLYSLYSMNQEHYAARWQNLTRSLRDSSGVLVPQPYIVRDRDLPHSSFRLAVRGSILAEERPPLDSIMVECHPDHAEILGLEIAQQAQHPLTSAEVFWTPLNPRARGVLEAGEIRSFDFLEYIFLLVYRF